MRFSTGLPSRSFDVPSRIILPSLYPPDRYNVVPLRQTQNWCHLPVLGLKKLKLDPALSWAPLHVSCSTQPSRIGWMLLVPAWLPLANTFHSPIQKSNWCDFSSEHGESEASAGDAASRVTSSASPTSGLLFLNDMLLLHPDYAAADCARPGPRLFLVLGEPAGRPTPRRPTGAHSHDCTTQRRQLPRRAAVLVTTYSGLTTRGNCRGKLSRQPPGPTFQHRDQTDIGPHPCSV